MQPKDPVIRRALLSVSNKTGLLEFARILVAQGVQLFSTGGTAQTLRDAGLTVTDVSAITGFPEMLDGRVKTLHPVVHGGLLGQRENPSHRQAMEAHGIEPIDLLVVNLYPFRETVARGANEEVCIENIDIGGPAMLRSAAKNHASVTVVVDPADYTRVAKALQENGATTSYALRRELAAKAYTHTARYDMAISQWFSGGDLGPVWMQEAALVQPLRYGENPHQKAAFYRFSHATTGLARAVQHQGKELSYNNINDTDAAYALVSEFTTPAVAIIKHANPCGVAVAENHIDAFCQALACDPVSAFGGIIAINGPLTASLVEAMGKLFVEVIIAPEIQQDALKLLESRKNIRVLEAPLIQLAAGELQVRAVQGGVLVQSVDDEGMPTPESLKTATKRVPSDAELSDLRFAFTVAKHVKSNAIVMAKDGATLGIGAGQMSRVDSVRIACWKAKEARLSLQGAVMASDAFFPFDDNIHAAAKEGIGAIIQPGGSIRDEEVIAAADSYGMAMVLTGIRHFRH